MKTIITILLAVMISISANAQQTAPDGDDSHVPPCPPSHEDGLQP